MPLNLRVDQSGDPFWRYRQGVAASAAVQRVSPGAQRPPSGPLGEDTASFVTSIDTLVGRRARSSQLARFTAVESAWGAPSHDAGALNRIDQAAAAHPMAVACIAGTGSQACQISRASDSILPDFASGVRCIHVWPAQPRDAAYSSVHRTELALEHAPGQR